MGALIISVLQPILWIVVLALVLSGVLASRLSRQITKPINNIDLENPRLDDAYEELFPLVGRLREQNRTISRQMEALSRRQREFAALAENMSEGVLLLDSRYNILYSNQSAYALLGGEEEKPESLRQETCRKEIWEAAGRALAGCHAESLMRAESHIFEILANPVTANGQVTGVVVLMVDVTEREERESLRREFSANVSHELKTPLTSISGFAELMKEGLVEADKMREFAGDIYKECGQLIALIDDIMKLSRLDEAAEMRWLRSPWICTTSPRIFWRVCSPPLPSGRSPCIWRGRSRPSWGCGASSMRWCTISVTTPSSTTRTAAR